MDHIAESLILPHPLGYIIYVGIGGVPPEKHSNTCSYIYTTSGIMGKVYPNTGLN